MTIKTAAAAVTASDARMAPAPDPVPIPHPADGVEEESDPLFHPDAEEAAICLSCGRLRCFLDDDLPCRRYDRAMRALRALRAPGGQGEEPGERGERTKEKGD